MSAVDKNLLERVVRSINRPDGVGEKSAARGSILKQAAKFYKSQPIIEEATVPSGFDPAAAVLFEAVVEAAFLVAASDGVFDDDERIAFESVVAEVCENAVEIPQLDALVADLREQLAEDGMEKRVSMVARSIGKRDHQIEVLRIAALMAHMSDGVGEAEKRVLEQIAKCFDLPSEVVTNAIAQADRALGKLE